jgi:SAM-dependent methyltransferase
MLIAEARWLADRIDELGNAAFPMLNVGSQTLDFRTRVQPWIDAYLFAPARLRRQLVCHADMQAADGVDFVGDIADESFVARMQAESFGSVLCCNLLEHVEDRARVARALTDIVRPEGHLILSVPHVFPYHPDPIDTMYRPDPEELASLFPGMLVVQSRIVRAGTLAGYALRRLLADPAQLAKSLSTRRSKIPATVSKGSSNTIGWALRPLKVTCLILRKA